MIALPLTSQNTGIGGVCENSRDRKSGGAGGGLIGSSWATNFLWKGLRVTIYDISQEAIETAKNRLRVNMEYLVSKQILSAGEMKAAKFTTSIEEAVKEVPFIQECVPEMANRPPDQGRTNEEIARWRDDGLIEILRFLKKI